MVETRRDYYEVLGVPRDADAKAIKEAFRALALRTHPDRNAEPGAEERFKEIAEAYAVLGDPKKRAEYDARGFAGVAGFSAEDLFAGVDFESLFGSLGVDLAGGGLFDRFFGRGRRAPTRGSDLEVGLEIPLDLVRTGGEQRVHVRHPQSCPECKGSGAKPGTAPRRCEACGGSGRQASARVEGQVHVQRIAPCSACRGKGSFVDEPCSACGGGGRVPREEELTVRVPVGAEEGAPVLVPGKGLPAEDPSLPPGDLYVVVRTAPDARFRRRGADLWRAECLALEDAVLGTSLEVPTLEGHASVQVPAGVQAGTMLRLRGKGLPKPGGVGHGDLYLTLDLRVPRHLSGEQRELWERLRDLGAEGE